MKDTRGVRLHGRYFGVNINRGVTNRLAGCIDDAADKLRHGPELDFEHELGHVLVDNSTKRPQRKSRLLDPIDDIDAPSGSIEPEGPLAALGGGRVETAVRVGLQVLDEPTVPFHIEKMKMRHRLPGIEIDHLARKRTDPRRSLFERFLRRRLRDSRPAEPGRREQNGTEDIFRFTHLILSPISATANPSAVTTWSRSVRISQGRERTPHVRRTLVRSSSIRPSGKGTSRSRFH